MKDNKAIILTCLGIVILLFCMHSCLYSNHDGEIIYEPYAGGFYTEVLADGRENTTVPWEDIDMFQIDHNDKAFDSSHADSNEYPMERVDSTRIGANGTTIFSFMDLTSLLFQIICSIDLLVPIL